MENRIKELESSLCRARNILDDGGPFQEWVERIREALDSPSTCGHAERVKDGNEKIARLIEFIVSGLCDDVRERSRGMPWTHDETCECAGCISDLPKTEPPCPRCPLLTEENQRLREAVEWALNQNDYLMVYNALTFDSREPAGKHFREELRRKAGKEG